MPTQLRRYALALSYVAVALALSAVVLRYQSFNPVVVLLCAIAVAALREGFGPGVLASFVVVASVRPLFFGGFGFRVDDAFRFIAFLTVCGIISYAGAGRRKAELELAKANAELERRVEERTSELWTALRSLADSEAKLRGLLECAAQGVVAAGSDGRITLLNARAEEMFGYSRDDLMGQPLSTLFSGENGVHPVPAGGVERLGKKRDGSLFPIEVSASVAPGSHGEVTLALITDITERRRHEEQLRHTQKLESLGLLAGGIAHDFNNLLTGIMGSASVAGEYLDQRHPARPLLDIVVDASEKAANLTRQMLAYSGKGRFVVEEVDLSQAVRDMTALLAPSIPKNVQVSLDLPSGLPCIEADVGQIQQVIMNLILNAAEAIGDRPGAVAVTTGTENLDAATAAASHLAAPADPGAYVYIDVRDNGSGMTEGVKARIFDPFFTTKFTGRGLGLAAVLGIVRGHRGTLRVESAPGRGTSFRVLFPAAGEAAAPPPKAPPEPDTVGSGAVMVVDDEELVRRTATQALRRLGYYVETAANGAEAVELFRRDPERYIAILLDLTMPVMDGDEALRRLQAIRPDIPVILSSGFNEAEAVKRFEGRALAGFLQKPYHGDSLARHLRRITQSAPSR